MEEDKPWTVPAPQNPREEGWTVVKIVNWGPEHLGSCLAGRRGYTLPQMCPFAVMTVPGEIIYTSRTSRRCTRRGKRRCQFCEMCQEVYAD